MMRGHTTAPAILVATAILTGCGARSGLGEALDSTAPDDRDASVPDRGDCPAALQPGAPAPVAGYCPTRANRSAFAVPDAAPQTRWTLDLPVSLDHGAQLIVAPAGRIYVRGDTTPEDAGWSMFTQLIAIDDRTEGVVAWTMDFEAPISSPLLLAGGSLLLSAITDDGGRDAVWLDAEGDIIRRIALPSDVVGEPAVGADGSLYFAARALDGERHMNVVATDAEGHVRWRSPALVRGGDLGLALGPGDQVVARDSRGAESWLVSLDPGTGIPTWETMLDGDGPIIDGPAFGPDGALHTVLWTDASTKTTLVVLEPDGRLRQRVDLPDPPWGGGVTSLSVGPDGTAFIKAGEGFVAVDAAGELLFRREVHPNIALGAVVDPDGVLLVGSGAIEAVKGADGTVLWRYEAPVHEEPTPTGGTIIYFPGPATLGDERLYFADAGGRLVAASPP